MVRLTFDGNFCDISQCRELPCKYDGNCSQKKVWERLKEYEDAGLSPQACRQSREIEKQLDSYDFSVKKMLEFIKADKDGRVVILPCKMGDTVYYVSPTSVRRTDDIVPIKFLNHWFEEFGKTVFVTREEAEKALAGKEPRGGCQWNG